jgi:membrane protease YdiL (CAAX protease family)
MAEGEGVAREAAGSERVNQRFAGVGAALGLILWANLFSFPLLKASFQVQMTHPGLSPGLAFLALLCALPGMAWRAWAVWGAGWRRAFPLAPVGPGLLAWTLLCILAFLALQFAGLVSLDRLSGLPHLPDPFARLGLLAVLCGAPLAEEAVFRGYGLARIRELAGERRALLFTAAMFALAHGSWVKLPGTFLMGLFLGWLVLRTGSLWPALLGHVVNNGTAFLMSRLEVRLAGESRDLPWGLILGVGATGLAALAVLASPWVRSRVRSLSPAPGPSWGRGAASAAENPAGP